MNAPHALPIHAPLGQHVLIDLYGCPIAQLTQPENLEHTLRQAAQAAGATVLASHFHHFGEQQGVTGVLLLMESHLSIHTWPEHQYAAVDIFMCGNAAIDAACQLLQTALQAQQVVLHRLARGGQLAQATAA